MQRLGEERADGRHRSRRGGGKNATVSQSLHFEIQQVAVDLVVDVGIILLLAQVQAWDVHGSLRRTKNHFRYLWEND